MGLFRIKEAALALGSGSAKGVSHIGVIEELERSGVKISAVAGTSMGGIVAAYYALGQLDTLKEWLLSFDKFDTFKTIDFTWKGGFISGKKLMSKIESHLGNAKFEDARIPLFIPATNLDTGEREIFTKGEILPAIRASISVPGVMKPYFHNGHYYVDGAVTNPVPADILIDEGYKNIIAVNLHDHLEPMDNDGEPGLFDALGRSMSIVSKYLALEQTKDAKVVISPKLEHVGMFEIYNSEAILKAGSSATSEAILAGGLDITFTERVKGLFKN